MDWGTITTQAIITAGAITTAWLALRAKLADIASTSSATQTDAAAARTASERTESSINNRDSPASDRWDDIHDDVKDVKKVQDDTRDEIRALREDHHTTQLELVQLHRADGLARNNVLALRGILTKHLQATEPIMPMLQDLHDQWATATRGDQDQDPENGERQPTHTGGN